VHSLLDLLQEQAIELKFDSNTEDKFETTISLEELLHLIIPPSSDYLCDSGFSTFTLLKTKQCNHLEVESDLNCALSSFKPKISELVREKQYHPSH
jgi:hypothetical protein